MLSFALRKLLLTIPILVGLSLIIFSLLHIHPDDPAQVLSGSSQISEQQRSAIEDYHHLNDSFLVQYYYFINRTLTGKILGNDNSNQSLVKEFGLRLPATLELALSSLLFALAIGIPLGVIAAFFKDRTIDKTLRAITMVLYSMPIFWLAYLAIFIFALKLETTPVAGRINLIFDVPQVTGFILLDILISDVSYKWIAFKDALAHLALPIFSLAVVPTALITRFVRNGMIEVLESEYIRTAQSTGVPFFRLLFVHALKNAMIPLLGMSGLLINILVTGVIVVEWIFVWPGIGSWLVESVHQQNFLVIQGLGMFICIAIVMINVFLQIIYAWFNPRIRRN